MESQGEEDIDFTYVIRDLVVMFGHILTKEVITTVVESCEGDLNQSMDVIMKITSEDGNLPKEKDNVATASDKGMSNSGSPHTDRVLMGQSGPSVSYAAQASQNKGAIPKKIVRQSNSTNDFWTDQIRKIITEYNKGSRVMIFMRGVPGSGKSYLANALLESMVAPSDLNSEYIFSTDDYFMVRGQYQYDKFKLSTAHFWNQTRVRKMAYQGLSPIIIDNTNIEIWEMQPYVTEGVKNGYFIEVVEPTTPWVKKPNQLFKKNSHNVPLHKIRIMLGNYTDGITGENLIRALQLSYHPDMSPPVKRLKPPLRIIEEKIFSSVSKDIAEQAVSCNQLLQSPKYLIEKNETELLTTTDTNPTVQTEEEKKDTACSAASDTKELRQEPNVRLTNDYDLTQETKEKFDLEAQKKLEEYTKFEEEWENGEKWSEDQATIPTNMHDNVNTNKITASAGILTLESKPPRTEKKDNEINCVPNSGNWLQFVNDSQDSSPLTFFIPPWDSTEVRANITPIEEVPLETTTSETCIEAGDTDVPGMYKVMSATSRDINEFYMPPEFERIPENRMMDKSTMTYEGIMMSMNCPQRERHFLAFRRIFKNIAIDSLRYIFDNCCGDVNWAVENVLKGTKHKLKENTEDKKELDVEDTPVSGDPCNCLRNYGLEPQNFELDLAKVISKVKETQKLAVVSTTHERKKRDPTMSDATMQLKRQIEQNVVISDSHYSEHCLKIRKIRRGEIGRGENSTEEEPSSSGTANIVPVVDSNNTTTPSFDSSDIEDEDLYSSNIVDSDRIVNINVGKPFINDLDRMFGRKNMEYPDNISYNISIPTSLLNEINALWMESLMFQLEEVSKISASMVAQDEEFARQLSLKEEELLNAGKEPNVPDFKEIMDLEFAMSLHLKDMSEWRNNIPTDLAAKMTHDKLFNLFPEIDHDTLLEMLMAHDNDFKATVEVLLMSMGRNDVLETENGINKFVMEKELKRQEKFLEEQRKELVTNENGPCRVTRAFIFRWARLNGNRQRQKLLEVVGLGGFSACGAAQELTKTEWPPLSKGAKVEMSTVQGFRDEAERHLNRRTTNMQKAEDYIRRGMTQVANYYSELANFHKTKYDHASSMAVASLMQYHANNSQDCETIDLHYFRVKEAMETLDLFLDTHIHRLRETQKVHKMIFFITGRGLRSPGLPRIKPACIKRLRERGLHYTECNPGLLRARISFDHKLICEIP